MGLVEKEKTRDQAEKEQSFKGIGKNFGAETGLGEFAPMIVGQGKNGQKEDRKKEKNQD